MDRVWMKIYSKDKKLMYEGFTIHGKPCGPGRSYYEDGTICQEGIFYCFGLINGREYFPNGKLRFEGAYRTDKGFCFPVFGSCSDEGGREYYYGELMVRKSAMGIPMIVKPEAYGPICQKNLPDFCALEWNNKRFNPGVCYVKTRSRKIRLSFIEFLEKNGFKCEEDKVTTRAGVLESRLPVVVDVENKSYSVMGNTTCAAAAVSARKIMTVDDFHMFYESLGELVIV